MNSTLPIERLGRAVLAASLLLVLCGGCGGPREIALKSIKAESAPAPGPAASPEELAGDVPILRGLSDPHQLVPPELIPPEAPADPEPGFN